MTIIVHNVNSLFAQSTSHLPRTIPYYVCFLITGRLEDVIRFCDEFQNERSRAFYFDSKFYHITVDQKVFLTADWLYMRVCIYVCS